jgi:SH3-like domain-containing protein
LRRQGMKNILTRYETTSTQNISGHVLMTSLMRTTQEPNHIAKLNAQAKKFLSQDLRTCQKQFCKAIDNYVKHF